MYFYSPNSVKIPTQKHCTSLLLKKHDTSIYIYICINESLRNVLSKGPEYREPRSINWNYNFKVLMDPVEDYARKLMKRK